MNEPAPRWANFLACGVIVLAGLAAYANTFSVPFVLDDPSSITDNPSIRHLWPLSLPLSPPHGGGLTTEGRPLVNLSLALNYAISGAEVWSYHVLNLAIHLLAGLTLFGLVRRTLSGCGVPPQIEPRRNAAATPANVSGNPVLRHAPNALVFALAAALLWTLHPLQTAAVTYVSQRAESLMGLFYLLTLYAFVRGTGCHPLDDNRSAAPEGGKDVGHLMDDNRSERHGRVWLAVSVVACLLGMATKEVMVTAPLIVLLYDRTFVAGSFRSAWLSRKSFYVALAGTWILLLILVIKTGDRGGTIGARAGVAWWEFAATQSRAIVRYLGLAVWPQPLIFDYGSDFIRRAVDIAPFVILDGALLVAVVVGLRRRRPTAFFGACFFVLLAPSSSVVGGTRQMLAEHRMYLPLAAVIGAGLIGAHAWLGRRAAWLGLGCAVVLGGATFARNRVYRDELSLWSDTVAKRPTNPWAHNNLGLTLMSLARVPEAMEQFHAAIQIRSDLPAPHNNLGNLLMQEGRLPEAIAEFEQALRLTPGDADVHDNLATALLHHGELAAAIAHFEEALRLVPDHIEAHNNLGNALAQSGQVSAAIVHFEAALRLQPNYVEVHNNLGNALLASNRVPEAIRSYETALTLRPNYPEAHFNLANALARQNQIPAAILHYEEALRLRPAYAAAQENLANTLLGLDRVPEAILHYEQAVRLAPDDPIVHYNFANALFRSGRPAEAATQCEMALQLRPDFPEARAALARLRAAQSR